MAELLAPAGNIETLEAAIGEGADAVYMGLKSFNARLRASNFAWNQFEATVQSLHRRGKKIFVTVNTVSEEKETERLYRFLKYLNEVGPDGIIVQDYGVVRMVQEFFPNLRIHASTQMNIASSKAVNLMAKEGVKRVVLARELGLKEIQEIRSKTTTELEVFVHGALCVSESGLCLFSSYLGGKSANRGMCAQACRRFYNAEIIGGGTESGYYFSPYDLQLIEKVPELVQAGVNSFKIEGRMKSAEYVGSVTAAYRYVLDNWESDKKGAVATGKRLLSMDFAREKTLYWYAGEDAGHVLNPKQAGGTGISLGKIGKVRSEALVEPEYEEDDYEFDEDGNRIEKEEQSGYVERGNFALLRGGTYDPEIGDSIRLHKKDDSGRVSHKIKMIRALTKNSNEPWIDIPKGFGPGDSVYLIQTKNMSKRYKRVLPPDIGGFRKQPGGDKLPILDLTPMKKVNLDHFPEGLYIQVSTLNDVFAILSEKPVRIILELNSETRRSLLVKRQNIPFSKKQVYISLDPFCPQAIEEQLQEEINDLIELGFNQFVVNNPAHIGMLKGKKVNIIAGPYLYTFNRWAVSWLENQNIDAFVMSHEVSQKTLEEILTKEHRKRCMINVFSYPALFRMRFKLPEDYDFHWFSDKEGMSFRALSTPDGSYVMPETPFSLIDKVNSLKTLGFNHFLIDMSKTQVVKSDLKQIMRAFYKGDAIPGASRFNWKDGFFDPENIRNPELKQKTFNKKLKK